MTAKDLQPFCSTSRPMIKKPFSRGEHTYATNGAILIRVARIEGVEDTTLPTTESIDKVTSIAGRKPLQMDDFTKWEKMPEWPESEFKQVCDECFDRGRILPECEACEGSGKQSAYDCEWGAVKIGNRYLGTPQLRPMKALPGLEFSAEVGKEHEAINFRFNGGCGVLMPVQLSEESKVWAPVTGKQS